MKGLALVTILCALTMPAAAAGPDDDSYMIRVMKCVGADASMELYLPQSLVFKRDAPNLSNILSMPPTIGRYTLDLSGH